MVEVIPVPDPHSLVPPLLAFLPTSFASSRPPPDLLPLLSPILRQRLTLNTSTSPHNNWSELLCWDKRKGEALKDEIENTTFEPHPSSGEIEVGDTEPIKYKRFDEETLKAQIPLIDWPFTAVYLWCTGGEEGNSWKLGELFANDGDLRNDPSWRKSISEANESAQERLVTEALAEADQLAALRSRQPLSAHPPAEEDDYWAMYDRTPRRTPTRKQPAVQPMTQPGLASRRGDPEDDAYYARYGEVQPALDSHDPDEEMEDGPVQSSLNGGALHHLLRRRPESSGGSHPPPYQGHLEAEKEGEDAGLEVHQPVPSSPSSKAGSDALARLEESAETYSTSQFAIREHIKNNLRSLQQLALSSGMSQEELKHFMHSEVDEMESEAATASRGRRAE